MSLARYLSIRGLGLFLFCLGLLAFGLLVLAFFQSGPTPAWILALIIGISSLYLVTPIAFSRRARVAEDSFVPSILPFSRRFGVHTPELSLGEISDIRNRMAGRQLIGLTFETHDGRTYLILRGVVGAPLFERFLGIKRRFYDASSR